MIDPSTSGSLLVRRLGGAALDLGIALITLAVVFVLYAILKASSRDHGIDLLGATLLLFVPVAASLIVGQTERRSGLSLGATATELERYGREGSSLTSTQLERFVRFRAIAAWLQAGFAVAFAIAAILLFATHGFGRAQRLLIFWTGIGAACLLVMHGLLWIGRWRLCRREGWSVARAPIGEGAGSTRATVRDLAAPRGRRLGAAALDVLLFLSATLAWLLVMEILGEGLGWSYFIRTAHTAPIALAGGLFLPVLLEAATGQSFGKALLGLAVLRSDGVSARPRLVAMRTFIRYAVPLGAYLFPMLPFRYQVGLAWELGMGGIVAMWSWPGAMLIAVLMPAGRGWYDHLLGTRLFRREARYLLLQTHAFEVRQPGAPRPLPVAEVVESAGSGPPSPS